MALSLYEADRMIAAAEKSGAKLMVGQLERFNPAMVALRPHVTQPLYFEIHRVSPFPNRSLNVDVVLDVMIHDLDAVQWLVGENVKVAAIHAVGIPIISDKVDAANARIEFENGTVANITASRIGTEKIRKTHFYQTNAYVVLDYANKFASLTSLNSNASHPLAGISIERLEINDIEPLQAEITAFLDAIENDTAVPVSGADGHRAGCACRGRVGKDRSTCRTRFCIMKSKEISAFLQQRIDANDFPSAVYLVAEKGEIVSRCVGISRGRA